MGGGPGALMLKSKNYSTFKTVPLKVAGSMKRDPGLVEMFIDKKTKTARNEGEVYTFPLLGDTLTRIAR